MYQNRLYIIILILFSALSISAQTAKQILDKTASIVGRTGGASANFRMTSPTYGSTSGIIAIKGKKFYANTAEAKVWFDGKTQWAYLKSTDEVSISTPTQAEQMAMNPYTFINIYKTGFKMNMKTISGNYEIHLIAQNKKRTIQEMYITIGKDYLPKSVKMRQGTSWTNIFISKFLAKDQNDSIFKFNSKDCPNAEIIDLR